MAGSSASASIAAVGSEVDGSIFEPSARPRDGQGEDPLSTVSAMPAKKRRSSTAPPKRAAASVPTFDPSDPMGQLRAFLEAAGADAAGAAELVAAVEARMDARAAAEAEPVDGALRDRVATLEAELAALGEAIAERRSAVPDGAVKKLEDAQRGTLARLVEADGDEAEAPLPTSTALSTIVLTAEAERCGRLRDALDAGAQSLKRAVAQTEELSATLGKLAAVNAAGSSTDRALAQPNKENAALGSARKRQRM